MQLAVVLLLGAALLSLGPYLAVDGRLTHIPLPFLLLDHLPLLDDILPSRICFEVGACLAAVIAFGLDDMRRAPARSRRPGDSPTQAGKCRLRRRDPRGAGRHPTATVADYAAPPAVALPAVLRRAVPAGDPVAITYPYDTAFTNAADALAGRRRLQIPPARGLRVSPRRSSGPSSLVPSVMSPPGLQQFLAGQERVLVAYGPALPVSPELVAITRTTRVQVSRSVGHRGPLSGRKRRGDGAVQRCPRPSEALGRPVLPVGRLARPAEAPGFSPHLRHQRVRDRRTTPGCRAQRCSMPAATAYCP